MSWLGLSAVHPLLLWGALAVAAPIIIHLLSKRKFRLIDWAAMDFLLEADRRNRRRVRLENLILLLLRCLAVALVAFLVARPFLTPEGVQQAGATAPEIERVIVLDDSPSMLARGKNNELAFDDAKAGLVTFVEELVRDSPRDRLTLVLTSKPDSPLINGKFLHTAGGADSGGDEVGEIVRTIKNLQPSERTADLDATFLALDRMLAADAAVVNRVVYLVSDLRGRDWRPKPQAPTDRGPGARVKKLLADNRAVGFVVVDVGADKTDNLTIEEIRALDETGQRSQLVAGVPAKFEVTIANHGANAADRVDVELTTAAAGTQRQTLEKAIEPGGRQKALFDVTFPAIEGTDAKPASTPIRASIDRADLLPGDNQRLFAARVTPGVQVLIVDGDPATEPEKSERYFLQKALAPLGEELTPFKVQWRSDSQFDDGLPLDAFQLIFLCNVYRISDEQLAALDKWVQAGGGLVVALGDRVDGDFYTEKLYAGGKGLLPIKLDSRQGDESQNKWVHFMVDQPEHPLLRAFEGAENAALLQAVKVFQWWKAEVPAADITAGRATVVSRWTDDAENTVAVAEKPHGLGRTLVLTTALDRDWNNWPGEFSYVPSILELSRYMARKVTDDGSFLVGQPLRRRLDPSEHKPEITLSQFAWGDEDKPQKRSESVAFDEATKRLDYTLAETNQVGFYRIDSARFDGEPESWLHAANLDPTEGDLSRITEQDIARQIGDERVTFVADRPALSARAEGAKKELWFPVLIGIAAVLGCEQFLAWLFGRRR
jgi:hypothetical protein